MEKDTTEINDIKRDSAETDYKEVYDILSDVQSEEHVQEMKNFVQHGEVSTYEHCENVAKMSYDLDKTFSLKSNLNTLLKGAMLHDFYLYDWHKGDGSKELHGYVHADKAEANAKKYFHVDEDTAKVIHSHMWPLNLTRLPASKEAWIVCIADKCCSLHETLFRRKSKK